MWLGFHADVGLDVDWTVYGCDHGMCVDGWLDVDVDVDGCCGLVTGCGC